jgi:chromate transporter
MTTTMFEPGVEPSVVRHPSLTDMARFFVTLGTVGFGGPIALVGYMEREFVERRRWVSAQEFADGLAFSQLAPGPLAAQLAIYLGWLCGGVGGATVAGIAFVIPSFLMVVVLAAFYLRVGGVSWIQGAFYGVGAAVIAVILRSATKLARKTLRGDRLLWSLFLVVATVTAWRETEVVWLFIACGLACMAIRARGSSSAAVIVWPGWLVTGLHGVVSLPLATTLFFYFASAGLFVFGSGLAIVPFLHDGVVRRHQWLTERQFLDAVAVALITPGPVVITVAFIGFLVAGLLGATAAAVGVFAPVYAITLLLAPHYQRLKHDARVRSFVDGVTAGATGAIAGAVVVLGRRAIVDVPTAVIAAATLGMLVYARRIPEPVVIVTAGVVGFVIKKLG